MANLIFRNNLKRLSLAVANDNLFKLFRKIRFFIDLSEFIYRLSRHKLKVRKYFRLLQKYFQTNVIAPEHIVRKVLYNQSADNTDGLIVSECRLEKWS